MEDNLINFIQENSPDGGFLQSDQWRKLQESVGRRTFHIEQDGFWANIIEHKLPIVGKYFYVPRGPIIPWNMENGTWNMGIQNIINLAKENNAGWIRIEPTSKEILKAIKNITDLKIFRAPHDMQPREIFVIDITKSEDELLAKMKSKTRYNIKLAEKRGVKIFNFQFSNHIELNKKYIEEFLRLVKITAKRDKITVHPDEYYQKMFETIPSEMIKLYVAEFEDKIIAANIVVQFGNMATYLHGASDDKYKNLMAPYLLQRQAILDAKNAGGLKYDFGGVNTRNMQHKTWNKNSWAGITRFKTSFSPMTNPTEFPGSYDIIINRKKYFFYRLIQKIKESIK